MDKRQLNIAMMQENRKRAFTIAISMHLVALIILAIILFFKSAIQELEDEIQVELIPQTQRQPIVKKKPIPKKEPVKPKQEMPIPKQQTPTQKKMITTKKVSDISPKHTLEIAKMPAGLRNLSIQQSRK